MTPFKMQKRYFDLNSNIPKTNPISKIIDSDIDNQILNMEIYIYVDAYICIIIVYELLSLKLIILS